MITRWREAFQDPDLWFGFVQIASFGYSHPYGRKDQRFTCKHSLANVSSFFEAFEDVGQRQVSAKRLFTAS